MVAQTAVAAGDVSAQATVGARSGLLSETEFHSLYRQHARALWAYLYRLTGNAADADDLVQESFCRRLATPLQTRDEGQLRAWLFRVATNAATDHWRRGGRASKRTEPLTDASPVTGSPDHGEAVALRTDMARTFRELKPQERVLLWLAHVEGHSHAEIAGTLGLKAASVPVLLFRARRRLADLGRRKGFGPGVR
jgi:RNA polymerase sigma-70 factor, ECF subfamily